MSTLHILYTAELPPALARLWSPGDSLLLAGPAVSLALRPDPGLPVPCLALDDAVRARGLDTRWPADIARLDASAWVALTVAHDKSLSWS